MLYGCSVERFYLRWLSQFICNPILFIGWAKLFCLWIVSKDVGSDGMFTMFHDLSVRLRNMLLASRNGVVRYNL